MKTHNKLSVFPSIVALALLTAYACQRANAQTTNPATMSWSTYNFFGARHNTRLFNLMADAYAAAGLRDAGYNLLRLDGGWWGDDGSKRHWYWTTSGTYQGGAPYADGDPHVDPANYPRGAKGLADEMHAKGMKLGMYLSPSLSLGQSPNYPGNHDPVVMPMVLGEAMVNQHAKWCAESGIDFVFYDGYDWNLSQGLDPYTNMSARLKVESAITGRAIVFSINTGWKAGYPAWCDEWRTARDIDGNWDTILECLNSVTTPGVAGFGHWNNPDYLMAGFVGDEEARTQMSLWCVAAAPLALSYDSRVMNSWDRYVVLNTEAIAVDQEIGAPGSRVKTAGNGQVWRRNLAEGSKAVVYFNTASNTLASLTATWAELGVPAGTAQVRDLWSHTNLGSSTVSFTVSNLPPHGCRFVKIVPGSTPLLEPPVTWAPHPGSKTTYTPLVPAGWAFTANIPNFNPALAFDGNPATGAWGYAYSNNFIRIDFGSAITVDRLVMLHRNQDGVGPQPWNPWPNTTYAQRSTFKIESSTNGVAWTQVYADSFGPKYTIAQFAHPVTARYLRVVLQLIDQTTALAYDSPTVNFDEIYVFNTANQSPVQAGSDQTIALAQGASLNGIAPVGHGVTWTVKSRPSASAVSFANRLEGEQYFTPDLKTVAYFSRTGVYTLTLTDTNDLTADDVQITVTANSPANGILTARRSLRIMPCGDSITYGGSAGGYRFGMQDKLTAGGYSFDFVGGRHLPADGSHDPDHEGHSGWEVVNVPSSQEFAWAGDDNSGYFIDFAGQQADCVLLMFGVNDMWRGYDPAARAVALGEKIDSIFSAAPNSHVIVAMINKLPENPDHPGTDARAQAFNAAIPGLVSTRLAQGKRISYVDMYKPWILATDSDGSVHPSATGYAKMAQIWYDGIVAATEGGTGTNHAPIVTAGGNQTITLPAAANLSGFAADDGLPNPPGALTTEWSRQSGPGTVTFGNSNAVSTTATFSTNGTYVLRFTASDAALSAFSEVTLTVNPTVGPSAPVIISKPATNAIVGQAYSYTISATGNPAPGYQLTQNPTGMTFNAANGLLSWTPGTIGVFNITLQATNGVNPDATQSFTIAVAPSGGGIPGRLISLNFYGSPAVPMGVAESAGVVAATYWNNINTLNSVALKYSGGASAGATHSASSPNYAFAANANITDAPGNARMMKGGYDQTDGFTHTITGIAFAKYELILYFDRGDDPNIGSFVHKFTVTNPAGSPLAGPFYAQDKVGDNFTGTFVEVPASSATDLQGQTPAGNYLRLTGLTAGSIKVLSGGGSESWASAGNGSRTRLNGLQIVELLTPPGPHGVPVAWLASKGLTGDPATEELADPDGDGQATWEEYYGGSNPTNSNSVFRITNAQWQGGDLQLTWYGSTNNGVTTPFQIFRATNLVNGTWTMVAGNLTRAANGTNQWTDMAAPLTAYYRVGTANMGNRVATVLTTPQADSSWNGGHKIRNDRD